MKLNILTILFLIISWSTVLAQDTIDSNKVADINLSQELLMKEVDYLDSLWVSYCKLSNDFTADTALLNIYNFPADSVPVYADSIIEQRLKLLTEKSGIDFEYNDATAMMINLYAGRRKSLISRMMKKGELYFPIFENYLSAYNMPYEFKYLPIVESALQPVVKSHMGAGGLWQFMPATGKSYGLEITSTIDERSDPYKSTEAACKYLTKLHSIYGDWNMALAAYNCGPGNVNKAIRKAKGKTDFWSIRPYLPKETRNYVPAFTAVVYIMNYASAHNIYPYEADYFDYAVDTLAVDYRVDFGVVERWCGINRTEVKYLNPQYTTEVIPNLEEKFYIKLPVELIGEYFCFEDSIKKYSSLAYKDWVASNEPARVQKYHYFKSGETLNSVAAKYDCDVQDILAWNTRTKIRVRSGRKIVVFEPVKYPSLNKQSKGPSEITESTESYSDGEYTYYTIVKGDTLWDIAQRYDHLSVEDIKKMNSHLNFNKLQTGTKIKIASK